MIMLHAFPRGTLRSRAGAPASALSVTRVSSPYRDYLYLPAALHSAGRPSLQRPTDASGYCIILSRSQISQAVDNALRIAPPLTACLRHIVDEKVPSEAALNSTIHLHVRCIRCKHVEQAASWAHATKLGILHIGHSRRNEFCIEAGATVHRVQQADR